MRDNVQQSQPIWVPSRVNVYGMYDYVSKSGGMAPAARDELAKVLLAKIPARVKHGFGVEKKWKESRRLVFICKNAGERCWELRQCIAKVLDEVGPYQGRTLKATVEAKPDVMEKRKWFWRAVDALRKQVAETRFVVQPRDNGLYEATSWEQAWSNSGA